MAGAGISVSAGIPDFRSPKTGLYANLQKYDLPSPEAIFALDYLRTTPKAFCTLAKELYPGEFAATPTHHFLAMLASRGLLRRAFTQNIDGLELQAGVDADKVMQAHGGFTGAHCIDCGRAYDPDHVKQCLFADEIPRCDVNDDDGGGCGGIVKPDIVFFGESLPKRFHSLVESDMPEADLLLVLGTSLSVQPFASLVDAVPRNCVRVLINREAVGRRRRLGDRPRARAPSTSSQSSVSSHDSFEGIDAGASAPHASSGDVDDDGHSDWTDSDEDDDDSAAHYRRFADGKLSGFRFGDDDNYRDMFVQGDCDVVATALVDALGWRDDLDARIAAADAAFAARGDGKSDK
jgi:NAD-dependent SIR2 family protein deacetylase